MIAACCRFIFAFFTSEIFLVYANAHLSIYPEINIAFQVGSVKVENSLMHIYTIFWNANSWVALEDWDAKSRTDDMHKLSCLGNN